MRRLDLTNNERAVLITMLRRLVDFHHVVSFKSPANTPRCSECCGNPRLLCRGTRSSNPSPSSRQSVSLRISPPSQERRGFSAILAAVRGGRVGRDAQSRATPRRGGVVSLSDDIPVPQCCRTRFARLAAPAANEGQRSRWAWSSDRLKQSRAGSVDLARPMADVSAPAACLRSGGMAGARREWLA